MAFGSNSVTRADLEFHAITGQAIAGTEEVKRVYNQAIGSMSTESLRAAVAEEKLDRAIARNGPTSLAAKNATLAYRREMESLSVTSVGTGRAVASEERSLGRLSRGAVVGSGAMRGLGRAVSYASTAFLGGVGLAYAIRATVTSAQEQQTALAQTAQALTHQNVSWQANRDVIAKTITQQEHLSAFTKTELLNSFTLLFRRTGNVNQALKDNALATVVARGGHKDLDTAVKLVNSSLLGQARGLKALGINIVPVTAHVDALKASTLKQTAAQLAAAKAADKEATAERIRAAILKQYGGAAAAFTNSALGKQAALHNAIHDTEVAIGTQLLPTVSRLEGHLTTWLSKSQNQARGEKDVSDAVRATGDVVHGLADAFHVAVAILAPFNRLLGGTRNSVETLLAVLAGAKLAGALEGISKLTGTGTVAGGGVLGVGAAAERSTGKVGILSSRLSGLGLIQIAPIAIPILLAVGKAEKGWLEKHRIPRSCSAWTARLERRRVRRTRHRRS